MIGKLDLFFQGQAEQEFQHAGAMLQRVRRHLRVQQADRMEQADLSHNQIIELKIFFN